MIGHLFDAIWRQLSNPFVSGGLLLTFTASIIALARSLPSKIWRSIKDQFVVDVEVASSDPLFDWITLWLNDQSYSKKTRRLLASTANNYEMGGDCVVPLTSVEREKSRPKLIMTPARGMHFFMWGGRLLWLTRGEMSDKTPDGGKALQGASMSRFRLESYSVRVFGRSQNTLRDLMNVVIDKAVSFQEKKISAFVGIYGNWRRLQTFTPRKLNSVILPVGQSERILEDLKDFISKQQWYEDMGIPYHRGYLFHGTPGSGKTSIIGALAGELRMNLYILNLSNEDMDDERFACLISEIPPRSFMVLEDIDGALGAQKRSNDKAGHKGLTLTGLLNSLDGFMAKDGSIVFMTTNHKNLLDSALIRPGRVDVDVEFEPATENQRARLFKRFFPDASNVLVSNFAQRRDLNTMAEAQQWLIRHHKDAGKASEFPAIGAIVDHQSVNGHARIL